VHASGFRKLVLLNGHGGQPQVFELVGRDIRAETGMQVFPLFPYRMIPFEEVVSSTEEAKFGLHGGELETAAMLAAEPSAVHMDRLEPGIRARELFGKLKYLSPEGTLPTSWLTRDLAPNGVVGDPTGATADQGERVLAVVAEVLAGTLVEIASFEF
jgi:creatinine amidohydrolase